MKRSIQFPRLFLLAILFSVWPLTVNARSYSSGGGHSYSSHSSSSSGSHSSSSSHSFSSPSHSFSSGSSSSGSSSHNSSSSSPGSSSRKSSSSSGKSYSSGSSSDDSSRRSYSSGKSYNSGSSFSSGSKRSSNSSTSSSKSGNSSSSSGDFNYDTAAARARKEEASKDTFTHYNDSRNPPPVIPRTSSTRAYRDTVYIPDATTLSTRSVRVQNVFQTYYMRPIVRYRDPYSSLFWWWLLDRSLDDRAMWAYSHRADMDAERYQALLNQDAQLQARVEQLEAQQTPTDPTYVPTGIDRDLMYTDEHLQHTYSTRPTTGGSVMFMLFAGILVACAFYFFVWLVFFHRWQTSSQSST